jgi:hypothetical protein
VEQPIRRHGETLDGLFVETEHEIVLLVDSDAEILDPGVVPRCVRYFDDERIFGAGFTDGPAWLGPKEGATDVSRVAYFQERPWMPFSMFRTSMLKEALAAGRTFSGRKLWNDFPPSARLSRILASRFQDDFVPTSRLVAQLPPTFRARIANWRLDGLRWLRRDFHGQRPSYVVYDTGADIYQWCKYERGWLFAGVDYHVSREVAHYMGLTRAALGDPYQVPDVNETSDEIRTRLSAQYDIDVPEFSMHKPISPT